MEWFRLTWPYGGITKDLFKRIFLVSMNLWGKTIIIMFEFLSLQVGYPYMQ